MKLNQKQLALHFLEQFNHCNDGVVRRIQIRFAPTAACSRAYLTLSVRQQITKDTNDGWVNVRLKVVGVEEFAIKESFKESCRVLSSGLQIEIYNELLFFDFAPYSLSPHGVEDYRRSTFYVAGRKFSWTVWPYSEMDYALARSPRSRGIRS